MKFLQCCIVLVGLFNFRILAQAYDYDETADMYYKVNQTKMSWVDAKLACAYDGGSLAMPRDDKEHLAILKALDAIPKEVFPEDSVWLGYHDMFEEGEYIDLQGVPIQHYKVKWGSYQPNNWGMQNCGTLWYSDKGLDDQGCNENFISICQKPGKRIRHNMWEKPVLLEDEIYTCFATLQKCYKIYTNPRQWSHARALCFVEGGNLAVIGNKLEQDALVEMMKSPDNTIANDLHSNRVLIGFHDRFREGLFTTVKDDELGRIGYFNPYLLMGDNGRNCGSLHVEGGVDDFPCHIPARYVCERPLAPILEPIEIDPRRM